MLAVRIAGTLLGLFLVLVGLCFVLLGDCAWHPFMEYRTGPDPGPDAGALTMFAIGGGFLVVAVLTLYRAWRRPRVNREPPAG